MSRVRVVVAPGMEGHRFELRPFTAERNFLSSEKHPISLTRLWRNYGLGNLARFVFHLVLLNHAHSDFSTPAPQQVPAHCF